MQKRRNQDLVEMLLLMVFFFLIINIMNKINSLLDESRNVMDDLIATIRSGAVFDRTDEKDTSKDQRKKR